MIDFLAFLFRRQASLPSFPLDGRLESERLLLRITKADDWRSWHFLREQGRLYLTPWEPSWPSHALTYGYFCSLLRRIGREWRSGQGYAFSILLKQTPNPVLIGGVTFSNIQLAALQKGTVGYWIGQPYAGQGYMTEALGLVCDFAFSFLKLQRVEASCLPHNEASKTVLRRSGFVQEGYAKAYMQINAKRQDHLLWGKNNPAVDQNNQ